MKTTDLITSTLLTVTLWAAAGCDQQQQTAPVDSGTDAVQAPELITVLNPAIAGKLAERMPLAPRLDSLEGKTIYMVDINWGGIEAAHSVFGEMQGWFSRNMPDVKVIVTRTRGNMFSDDPALWKEIAEQGDAAIVGVAS